MLGKKIAVVTCVFLCLSFCAICANARDGSDPQNKKTKTGKQPDSGDTTSQQLIASADKSDASKFIGSEACAQCHQELQKSFDTGPHWKTLQDQRRGVAFQGCEGCHGPGKEHAESGDPTKIIRFTGLSQAQASQRCLRCHEYGRDHANFLRSPHFLNDVGCTSCHSIHHGNVTKVLLIKPEPLLCYSCHLDVKPAFSMPYHHKVNEGLLQCSNCHNVHGGFITRQLRSTAGQDVLCFNCHTDKAGPFAFEHAPVKTEGCVACHMPHGSTNPRLLRRSQVNLLCLECHTLTVDQLAPAIPTFHNQAQKYQACTMCHVAIHGSFTDHFFFKP
jgi:DmsE family decaheme c-type cytochrome